MWESKKFISEIEDYANTLVFTTTPPFIKLPPPYLQMYVKLATFLEGEKFSERNLRLCLHLELSKHFHIFSFCKFLVKFVLIWRKIIIHFRMLQGYLFFLQAAYFKNY